MEHLAHVDAALDELVPSRLDVGDDEVQALSAPGFGLGDSRADADRALRTGRRQLHDSEVLARPVVDVEPEAGLLVEGLGPVDVGHRKDHQLEA